MGQTPVIQTSFNAGEWAPALNARVDVAKYHAGAALLRNFFVDYRGGATARPGTEYVLQTFKTSNTRLIPFQASFSVSYILEFGDLYVRFINNGAHVLETAKTITGITRANPGVVTSAAHGYSNGDWVFITGVVGMTQVNSSYFIVAGVTANTFQLADLNGNLINSSAFTAYTSGGTVARVYTLVSPYTAAELADIKFSLNVSYMVLCHPNHPPYQLTLVSAASWTLAAITFGSSIAAPTGQAVATTLGAGSVNYAYVITAVDSSGQESLPSAFAILASKLDIRTNAGSNVVTWTAVTGAASYNVYEAEPRYTNAVAAGAQFGFVGNCTATTFTDSNITPDFSSGPPVTNNPFSGTGVQSVVIGSAGAYTSGTIPTVSFSGGGGSGAAGIATAQCTGATVNFSDGGGYSVGMLLTLGSTGVIVQITACSPSIITAVSVVTPGSLASGATIPTNPVTDTTSGDSNFNLTWGIVSVGLTSPGTGYATPPTVTFSSGAATATSVLGASSSGNPTVPGFFQQRLVLAGPVSSPQQFNMSCTGAYYNFNYNSPIEPSNTIQGTLVSGSLNTIQSMVSQPYGLIILSDKQAWLLNGGSNGAPVTPASIVANAQAYNGASSPPPIVANDNILYVQAKGSIVRDLVFNYYTQVYTGADITVLSSHLFYGHQIIEWAWAEEPFKVVWAVREDGDLLSLTFLKEQELIAWAHSDTNGSFKSIATVTETVAAGAVDAVYLIVQRSINGVSVQYIERMAELYYPVGVTDAWCVDAGLQYNGTSVLTFTGAQHLSGASVTGLATDNLGNVTVIPAFTMAANGQFTLTAPASPATGYTRVTVGLAFTPQLQTLALDIGEPTIQGKRKKITGVTVRVENTLGLQIGRTFDSTSLVNMYDLVVGNLSTMSNSIVTDFVTGDARQIIDPLWDVPGQYCIQQPLPYPASILGVIPEIAVGDVTK